MYGPIRALVLVPVLVLALPSPAGAEGFVWWRDATVRQVLMLTPAQVKAIDREYVRTLPRRRALRRQCDEADAELKRAMDRGDLTDQQAQTLIDRVTDLHARRNVARTLLIVSMYRVLTPAQRAELDRLDLADRSEPPSQYRHRSTK